MGTHILEKTLALPENALLFSACQITATVAGTYLQRVERSAPDCRQQRRKPMPFQLQQRINPVLDIAVLRRTFKHVVYHQCLAITQGNARLARLTLKATSLGFVTAFFLAYLIGHLSIGFLEPTPEMSSRDWPQLRDLIVAFVSGLAAAYASGRPGLLAALPGVAIAAALLPPVATAGLAMSIGDYDLALGALLLFAVNMVAIVLAAAVSLRAMGIRDVRDVRRLTSILGRSLAIISLVMTLMLVFAPPLMQAPAGLVQAVESMLVDDEFRLRRIRLHREHAALNVQVDVGGSRLPDTMLQQSLAELAREHLGEETGVRLTFRYETLVK